MKIYHHFAAGGLAEPVDILSENEFRFSRCFQFGQGQMR